MNQSKPSVSFLKLAGPGLVVAATGIGSGPHWTLAEMAKAVAREPLRFQPGNRWSYSTAGIDVLCRVVEVAGGKPFAELMQARLLDPLGMKNTTWWISAAQEPRWTRSYRMSGTPPKLEETTISYMYGGAVTDHARPPLGGARVAPGRCNLFGGQSQAALRQAKAPGRGRAAAADRHDRFVRPLRAALVLANQLHRGQAALGARQPRKQLQRHVLATGVDAA